VITSKIKHYRDLQLERGIPEGQLLDFRLSASEAADFLVETTTHFPRERVQAMGIGAVCRMVNRSQYCGVTLEVCG
jgi:hypothetical protein